MSSRKQQPRSFASSGLSNGDNRVFVRPALGAFAMMAMAQRVLRSGMGAPAVLSTHTSSRTPRIQTPANQLYPRSSQKPPGNRFVTNIAVIHLGFLNPSLVGIRSFNG